MAKGKEKSFTRGGNVAVLANYLREHVERASYRHLLNVDTSCLIARKKAST